MKVILRNTILEFQSKRNYKYNFKYDDLKLGFVEYALGILHEEYQRHSEDLIVSEGDTIEYCAEQTGGTIAIIAAYDSAGNYIKDSSVQSLSNEGTEEAMQIHTYTVPAGVTKVIFSTWDSGNTAKRSKMFVRVYKD